MADVLEMQGLPEDPSYNVTVKVLSFQESVDPREVHMPEHVQCADPGSNVLHGESRKHLSYFPFLPLVQNYQY